MAEPFVNEVQRLSEQLGQFSRRLAVEQANLRARADELDRREKALNQRESDLERREAELERKEKADVPTTQVAVLQDLPSPLRAGGRPPKSPDSNRLLRTPERPPRSCETLSSAAAHIAALAAASDVAVAEGAPRFGSEMPEPVSPERAPAAAAQPELSSPVKAPAAAAAAPPQPPTWTMNAAAPKDPPRNHASRPTTAAEWGLAAPPSSSRLSPYPPAGDAAGGEPDSPESPSLITESIGAASTLRNIFEMKAKRSVSDERRPSRVAKSFADTVCDAMADGQDERSVRRGSHGAAAAAAAVAAAASGGPVILKSPPRPPSSGPASPDRTDRTPSRAADELAVVRAARAAAREERESRGHAGSPTGTPAADGSRPSFNRRPTLQELLKKDEEKLSSSRGD